MDKDLFVSSSNYFDRLRCKAREIDEDIDRLVQTWKTPYLFVGGYAERTDEINVYLEELWNSIRNTDDTIEKMQMELGLSLKQMDQFLEKSREVCQNMKNKSDNIDTVLMEYGYHYHYEEDNDNIQESHYRDDSKNHTDDSATGIDEIPDMEVEFTPNLTWKSKARSKGSDASDCQSVSLTTKSIATPVIKNLASVRLETSNAGKIFIDDDTSVQKEANRSKVSAKMLRK